MENCFWALKSPHTRMKPKKNRPVIYYDRPTWRRTLIIIPQVLAAPHFAGGVHFSKYQNLHPSLCMYVFAYGIWLISP